MQKDYEILKKTISPTIILCCSIAIIGRLIPHPWGATPNLAILFAIGKQLSKRQTILFGILTIVAADILINISHGYALFGTWALFTYSGWAVIALICSTDYTKQLSSIHTKLGFIVTSSIAFWVWTNFGVWLCSPIYERSILGLTECFTMGLPFLKYSLIGNIIWSAILLSAIQYSTKKYHTTGQTV